MKRILLFFVFLHGCSFDVLSMNNKRIKRKKYQIRCRDKRVKITKNGFIDASRDGHYVLFTESLKNKHNIFFTDGQKRNVLHRLLKYEKDEYIKCVSFLLEYLESNVEGTIVNQFINAKDARGNTPLHYAALINNTQPLEMLIGMGANVNINNNAHDAPLHYALIRANVKNTLTLLNAKANSNAKDTEGKTPVVYSMVRASGIYESLRLSPLFKVPLIMSDNYSENEVSDSDEEFFFTSSQDESIAVSDDNIDENIPDQKEYNENIKEYNNLLSCFKLLLQAGADIDIAFDTYSVRRLFTQNCEEFYTWMFYYRPKLCYKEKLHALKLLNNRMYKQGELSDQENKERLKLIQSNHFWANIIRFIHDEELAKRIAHGDVSSILEKQKQEYMSNNGFMRLLNRGLGFSKQQALEYAVWKREQRKSLKKK